MSTSPNERQVHAYRNATSCSVQPSSSGTFSKMISTATKSRIPNANEAARSSANDVRYWSCERTWAPTSLA